MSISTQKWKSADLKLRPGSVTVWQRETTLLLQFSYLENEEVNAFHQSMLKEYCDESEDKSLSFLFSEECSCSKG